METGDLIKMAKATAVSHGIKSELLCALCERESSWDTWAIRYEPNFYLKYLANMQDISQTEKMARAFSYGLCQTMGQVARELGFQYQWLTELCDPVVGLEFGARKLKQCLDAAKGNSVVALLRYNGGGDPDYADKVLKLAPKYR